VTERSADQPSGQLTFESGSACDIARLRDRSRQPAGFDIPGCDFRPEDLVWTRIPNKEPTMFRIMFVLPALLVGCAAQPADDDTDSDSDAVSGPTRHLNCQLEYETFSPAFASFSAASFDTKYTVVKKSGASATDGAFTLAYSVNPTPPSNLSDSLVISNATTGGTIAYLVVPSPHLGGDFLYELGGKIDPVTPTGATQAFDFMRGYCALVLE
jgi:hypothetical protein